MFVIPVSPITTISTIGGAMTSELDLRDFGRLICLIGAGKTLVRIIASPSVRSNIHEVSVISSAGKVLTRTQNLLHPENPKTSFLAVLSAAAMLKHIVEPVVVGT